jgi:hypothetical protein
VFFAVNINGSDHVLEMKIRVIGERRLLSDSDILSDLYFYSPG